MSHNIWSLSWAASCESLCLRKFIFIISTDSFYLSEESTKPLNPKATNAKMQRENRPCDIPDGLFLCQCCGSQHILHPELCTEVSKLPFTLSPLRKRGSLQILPVVVIHKLSVFELKQCYLWWITIRSFIMLLGECVLHSFYKQLCET